MSALAIASQQDADMQGGIKDHGAEDEQAKAMGGALLTYNKIAEMFKAGNNEDLEVMLVAQKEDLDEDKNFGLAK